MLLRLTVVAALMAVGMLMAPPRRPRPQTGVTGLNPFFFNEDRVVLAYKDGRRIKGRLLEFDPDRGRLWIAPWTDGRRPTVRAIRLHGLKAVFFVKDFTGDPRRNDRRDFLAGHGVGEKALIQFEDGEVVAGYVHGTGTARSGLDIMPADPQSNNLLIFAIQDAVTRVRPAEAN
ncbi:MAG: hypothetical protein ACE5HK_06795 [Candidatus Methylomirabilales bacterium]